MIATGCHNEGFEPIIMGIPKCRKDVGGCFAMSRKFYISDLHLGHKNAIKFDGRPFLSIEEMTETIVANWNMTVSKNDEVYILGDFAWKATIAAEAAPRLKGKKFLLIGIHDHITNEVSQYFEWCKPYEEIFDNDNSGNGTRVILCHYPITHWHSADKGSVHLYGHIHSLRDSHPFDEYRELMRQRDIPYWCCNVGCMLPYMNYTPRTLTEILTANEL